MYLIIYKDKTRNEIKVHNSIHISEESNYDLASSTRFYEYEKADNHAKYLAEKHKKKYRARAFLE